MWILSVTGLILFSVLVNSASKDEEDPNRRGKVIAYSLFVVTSLALFLATAFIQFEIINRSPLRVLDLAHQKARNEMSPSFKYPEEVPLRGPHRIGMHKSLNWGANQTLEITPRKGNGRIKEGSVKNKNY